MEKVHVCTYARMRCTVIKQNRLPNAQLLGNFFISYTRFGLNGDRLGSEVENLSGKSGNHSDVRVESSRVKRSLSGDYC